DDDRFAGGFGEFHRKAHALVRGVDAAVEIALVAFDQGSELVRSGVGIGLRDSVDEHAWSAMKEVRGRKSRAEGQRRHGLALKRRQLLVDALAGLIVGALPADWNQKRQLPERLCQFSL